MPIVTRTIEIEVLQCSRCGHEWQRRYKELPKVCPKCKRQDWNQGSMSEGGL